MPGDVARLWRGHGPVLQRGGVHAEPGPCAAASCHVCRPALPSFSSEAIFIQVVPRGGFTFSTRVAVSGIVSARELKAKVKMNLVLFRGVFG